MTNFAEKEIFIFDVDGTVADSYRPVQPKNAEIICNLLKSGKIIVFATGRARESLEEKVLALLPCGSLYMSQIYMLPAGGAAMYSWEGGMWQEAYTNRIDAKYEHKIIELYKKTVEHVDPNIKGEGCFIENKDYLMLSCAAVGYGSTKAERLAWDPNHEKRMQIIGKINEEFPHLDVSIGGSATIDITKKGVNKADGLNRLFDILKLDKKDALFIGDGVFPGGNDYCILETGIDILKVESPKDMVEKFKV